MIYEVTYNDDQTVRVFTMESENEADTRVLTLIKGEVDRYGGFRVVSRDAATSEQELKDGKRGKGSVLPRVARKRRKPYQAARDGR